MSRVLPLLLKWLPSVHRWRIRAKMSRWRRQLTAVDQKLRASDPAADVDDEIARLAKAEAELAQLAPPTGLQDELAHLRWHVTFALDRLWKRERRRAA